MPTAAALDASFARYAVYWVPAADHPLWRAGCHWLGRDPEALAAPEPAPPGRQTPWRYGFHATLKAPMHLVPDARVADLLQAVKRLAQRHARFQMPHLHVDTLADFLALRPAEPVPPPLRALAEDCVCALDTWRAPLSPRALAERCQGLDAEQDALLRRWGYPHVLQRWRLHLTLTDALADPAVLEAQRAAALVHFAQALREPLWCTEIAVFVETSACAPLRLLARLPLRSHRSTQRRPATGSA